MAITATHGTKAVLMVGGQNLTSYLTNTDLALTRELAHLKLFGEKHEQILLGIVAGTLRAAMAMDSTIASNLFDMLMGDSLIAWELGPFGATAPNIKFSGNLGLSNFTLTNPNNDAVNGSIEGAISGTVTKGVYS